MNRISHLKIGASLALTSLVVAAGCGSAHAPQTAAPPVQPNCVATEKVDRDLVAPVLDGSAVERVRPLYSQMPTRESNVQMRTLEGASITVRPPAGVSAELLGRALTCRSAELAHESSTAGRTDTDPFWLPGKVVRIRVDSNPNQSEFVIQAAGYDSHEAREILARAQALSQR